MSSRSTRRIERSCAVCHRRKVRCDRKSPCSQCIRSNFECSYPSSAGPPVRRVRKTTINDVASRISQMERTIESFRTNQDTASQVTTSSTPSVTSANTPVTSATVTTTGVGVRDEFPRQAVERREGLLLNKGRFSHYVNEVLLSRVIEQVQIHIIPVPQSATNTYPRKMMYEQPWQRQETNSPTTSTLPPLPSTP
jgi:hypothetical protein